MVKLPLRENQKVIRIAFVCVSEIKMTMVLKQRGSDQKYFERRLRSAQHFHKYFNFI
jgi:hypothetical protein